MDGRLVGGRYRLLDARALGGMAAIWRAADERRGDTVAVKLLHPHLAGDGGARERFLREASALRSVSHPNLVPIRDVVDDETGPALVMDFIDGRSLEERLAQDGPMPALEALPVALDVAEALAAVHAHGLVHRDVKPGNILVGTDGRTHLIDFGIAAVTDPDESSMPALTAPDDVVGTMRYLAPERLAGQTATAATDVWGLGAALYEMVAGAPAFPAASLNERVTASETLPARPPGLSDGAWAVLVQSLAADPADRYADAAAMAADLRALSSSGGLAADPDAATAVIPLPVAPALSASSGPVPAARTAASRPDSRGGATPSRSVTAGALVLVAAVGLAALASAVGPSEVATDRSADPTLTVAPTPVATSADKVEAEEAVEPADPPGKAKGKDNDGKGKGKGSGKGKRD